VAEMNVKLRKIIEILLIIVIVGLSIAIFMLRDRIQNVSNVSYLGLFLLCFLANSTVLLPAPSLMIAASCALIMNPVLVARFAAIGSTLGEFVGYAFGTVSKDLSPKLQKVIDKYATKIHNQSLLVFTFAVLPLPLFDIVGIYSGGTKMNLVKFFIVCFAGKLIKTLVYTRIFDIMEWATSYVPWLGGLQ
jgi:membrane protein YqaA with SNARE-associated domain